MEFTKVNELVREVLDSPRIETKKWKPFKLDDLFECETAEQQLKVEEIKDGFPYVSRSAFNNGITKFVKKIESKVNKANCITIGAEGYYAFFQEKDFMAGNKVYVIRNENLNKWNGLFICSLLNSIVGRYSYNDARILQKIKDEVHMLPVDQNGQPDWKYMEKYIRERERNFQEPDFSRLEKLPDEIKNSKKIYINEWKEFKLSNLFEISGTKTTKKDKLMHDGSFPYVTTRASNNGIDGYFDVWTEKGNCLTIDSAVLGWMNYQEENFTASDHVEKLTPNFELNKFIAMFICSIWNKTYAGKKYSYTTKASQRAIANDLISLPTNKRGQPDWKYMEDFVRERERDQKRVDESLANITKWNSFKIKEVFTNFYRGQNKAAKFKNKDGDVGLIAASGFNNGISYFANSDNAKISDFGSLTMSANGAGVGSTFFQKDKFIATNDCWVLENKKITKWNGLFLCFSINAVAKKQFAWTNKPSREKLLNTVILLPSKNNEPDWEKMEQMAKSKYEYFAKTLGIN